MPENVAYFGGNPEDSNALAQFTQQNGSAEDMLVVNELGMDTVRSALALWIHGASYGDIATKLKFRKPVVAQMAIERALAEQVDDHTDRTKLRRRLTLTLDSLQRAILRKALDPDNPEQLAAARVSLTIIERYSRLNGLDAPLQVDVNMPKDAEFQGFIAAAARGMGLEVPDEAEIFDDEYMYAEVVEDEEADSESDER